MRPISASASGRAAFSAARPAAYMAPAIVAPPAGSANTEARSLTHDMRRPLLSLRGGSRPGAKAVAHSIGVRSLDPFRALREPGRRRQDEERPSRAEQRTLSKTKNNYFTRKPHTRAKHAVNGHRRRVRVVSSMSSPQP